MEGVAPAVRAPRALGARDAGRGPRAGARAGPTARPTWCTRRTPPRAASGSPPTPRRRRFFEGHDAFPAAATHERAGLTLLFPPTHPEREIPGDLVASAFYLLARWDELQVADARSLRPPAAGGERLRPHRRARPGGARRWRATSPRCGDALGIRRAHRLERGPDPRHRPHPAPHVHGPRGHRPAARARAAWRAPWWGPIPGTTSPTCSRPPWLRGVRPDGLPDRAQRASARRHAAAQPTSASGPALAAAVRAAGAEVGLHASFASSEDGAALASELAGLRAEVGPVEGVRFHYLRFRYHQTVRWLEDAGADVRLEPRLQRGAGLRGGHRPPLPAVPGRRGAPGAAHAAAAGGDGHHAALAPRARRRRGPRPRPGRARAGARVRGPGRPAVAQQLPRRRPRPGLRTALGRPPRRPRRARRDARPGRGARPGGGRGAPRRAAHRAPDERPPAARRADLPQGGPRGGRGGRDRLGRRPGAPDPPRPAPAGRGVAARARGPGARRRRLPRPRPRAAAGRAVAGARQRPARWSTTCTSTSGQTTRTKRWIPAALRRPLALAVERAERRAAAAAWTAS